MSETTDPTGDITGSGRKQFKSKRRDPIAFDIDEDTFYAVPIIAAEEFGRLAEIQVKITPKEGHSDTGLDASETIRLVLEMVEIVLMPASVQLMAERLRSKDNGIAIETVSEVFNWLMKEHYKLSEDTAPTPPVRG